MRVADISTSEFAPYYRSYIELAGEGELLQALHDSRRHILALLDSISEKDMEHRYADGKWSIKELILHLIDSERVFAYRALRFARQDNTDLPGFDQDDFVVNSFADHRTKLSLLNEYNTVREASISLFQSFDKEALLAIGNANNSAMSVRALGFVIVGHEQHHARIIRERYI